MKNEDDMMIIFLVEQHQHALEHVHSVLRKSKMLGKTWNMLHFDAHPDLAAPGHIPAAACFNPRGTEIWGDPTEQNGEKQSKDLYDLLDSTASGISEWILPLVLGSGLAKVRWVRPEFSDQLPLGAHVICVGVCDENATNQPTKQDISFLDLPSSSRVKVDFEHPYYFVDLAVSPKSELLLSKPLTLEVVQLPSKETSYSSTPESMPWVLDVCLDYFACLNPFLADLERVNPNLFSVLDTLVKEATFFKRRHKVVETYVEDRTRFHSQLKAILEINNRVEMNQQHIQNLLLYYDDSSQANGWITELMSTMPNCAKSMDMAVEALPYWHMPHAPWSMKPEHIDQSLNQFSQHIRSLKTQPFMISVARSTDDGFTPKEVVDDIQKRVLDVLHETYCGCDSPSDGTKCGGAACRVKTVKDYGPTEGSCIDDAL